MLRSLLVPLDGSTFSEHSLPLASQVARCAGASLHLAQVHVPYEPEQLLSNTQFHFEGVSMAEYDARHRDHELDYLSGLAEHFAEEGMPVDAELLEGSEVADELVAYAGEVDTDMIVMTSHGYSGVSRLWLGSVADEMIRRTELPLLVVHPQEGKPVSDGPFSIVHVLVPLDGSRLAESVLGPAADLAAATGARMTLAHVVRTPAPYGPGMLTLKPENLDARIREAGEYLEKVAAPMRRDGLDVSIYVGHGTTPPVQLSDIAERLGADVIAIATHGHGGLKRTLLGSVADKLLRVTPLPLLVMRPRVQA
jgi:nucleotide-binding universal stress UspA family protein